MFGKVELLKEATLTATTIGVETDAADFDEALKLMKLEAKYDEEGK